MSRYRELADAAMVIGADGTPGVDVAALHDFRCAIAGRGDAIERLWLAARNITPVDIEERASEVLPELYKAVDALVPLFGEVPE
jgi:hypothetical protein